MAENRMLTFVKHKNVYLQQTQLLYIKTNEKRME